jgi:hypothetical protein
MADPPGFLPVLGSGPVLPSKFFTIPGSFLPAGPDGCDFLPRDCCRPGETPAVWYGTLNSIVIIDPAALTYAEKENYAGKRHCFWFDEAGMAGVATNKGVIVHPRATERQIAQLEEVARVPVGTGSINMGGGLVGTGLLANEHGYLAGNATSGFELGRIEDVFGFLK